MFANPYQHLEHLHMSFHIWQHIFILDMLGSNGKLSLMGKMVWFFFFLKTMPQSTSQTHESVGNQNMHKKQDFPGNIHSYIVSCHLLQFY